MANDYNQLQTDIAAWLARSDITSAQIQSMISICDSWLARKIRLRAMDTKVTLSSVAGSDEIALPTGYIALRSMYITDGSGSNLYYCAPENLPEVTADDTGRPIYFTIYGTSFKFDRKFDAVYSLECIYTASFTPLSGSNLTNWLTQNAYDVYLWGSLAAAEAFLMNDERVGMWKAQFEQSLDELASTDKAGKYENPTIRVETSTP